MGKRVNLDKIREFEKMIKGQDLSLAKGSRKWIFQKVTAYLRFKTIALVW